MTKQQKLCVGAGSAFGLCVLALGWFLYSAYAERKEIMEGGEETPEGLESAKGKYGDFFQKNPEANLQVVFAVINDTVFDLGQQTLADIAPEYAV